MFPRMSRELLSAVTGLDFKSVILLLVLVLGVILGAVLRQPAVLAERLKTARAEQTFTKYKLELQEAKVEAAEKERAVFQTMKTQIGEINAKHRDREAQYAADNERLRRLLASERVRREAGTGDMPPSPPGETAGADTETAAHGVLFGEAGERIVRVVTDADQVLLQAQECQAYVEAVHRLYGGD